MTNNSVLVTDCDLPGSKIDTVLSAAGYRVISAPGPSSREIIESARGCKALIVQWAPITDEILDALPELRFISRLGIGYDMIDVEAATARGIAVANTPSYCIEEVSSHTIAMIMALSRGLIGYDHDVRAGKWSAVAARPTSVRPSTKTVSVIGFGRIGSMVAKGCAALGFNVIVADPFLPPERIRSAGFEPVTREEAISRAEILTLHVPLTAETLHLLDGEALASMKPGAIIVNTCRGGLIDEGALASSLQEGHTGAAGLDVFAAEPLSYDSPLRKVNGVLLSPHAAWYSEEALLDLPEHAANNVIEYFKGNPVGSIVNPLYRGQAASVSSGAGR